MKRKLDFAEDRRKHKRKKLRIDVQLKLGIHLKGTGYTEDISMEGVRIKSPEIFSYFKPEQTHVFESAEITMFFPREGISIHGKVVRIDAHREELSVKIIGKSSKIKWQILCD
jgi:hypothetical protein